MREVNTLESLVHSPVNPSCLLYIERHSMNDSDQVIHRVAKICTDITYEIGKLRPFESNKYIRLSLPLGSEIQTL